MVNRKWVNGLSLFFTFFRDPVTPVFNERIITIEDPSFENPVEKCSNAEEEISRILRKSYQDDLNNMANINGRMPQVLYLLKFVWKLVYILVKAARRFFHRQ